MCFTDAVAGTIFHESAGTTNARGLEFLGQLPLAMEYIFDDEYIFDYPTWRFHMVFVDDNTSRCLSDNRWIHVFIKIYETGMKSSLSIC
jgi:hypothetical protein